VSKQPRIIGLAGTNGSGKDTVGQVLADHAGYLFISGSELLRDEAKRRKLPVERENLRMISAEWRRQYGLGVLIDRALVEFEKQSGKYTGFAIASIRNPGEADRVHELGGIMIWVDADPKIRYDRVVNSNRGRSGEDTKTFEQFLAEEAAEMNKPAGGDDATLNMAAVKQKCDIFLPNNGNSLESFQHAIVKALGL
jgi:dephospho-CoA kinase